MGLVRRRCPLRAPFATLCVRPEPTAELHMPYAMILIAALVAGCGEAKTPSKDAGPDVAAMTASAPVDPSAASTPETALERIDKGDGLVVDVLQAGAGRAVQMGDTVTLEYTISFVPPPTGKADAKVAKDGKDA